MPKPKQQPDQTSIDGPNEPDVVAYAADSFEEEPACAAGFHWDAAQGMCVPDDESS